MDHTMMPYELTLSSIFERARALYGSVFTAQDLDAVLARLDLDAPPDGELGDELIICEPAQMLR